MPVLAHHDLRAEPVLHQFCEVVGTDLVGLKARQPDAVEADIGAAVDHLAVVGGIGVAAAMADQAALRLDAAVGEQLLLLRSGATVLRVGDDRHAGRLLRDAGRGQKLLFQRCDDGAPVATLIAPALMPVSPMPWVISRM